jgi:hypothetical protein
MMSTFSEIIYYIDEKGFVIKHHKDMVPFCWVYIEPSNPEYTEYQVWLDAGNSPIPIIGTPKETES